MSTEEEEFEFRSRFERETAAKPASGVSAQESKPMAVNAGMASLLASTAGLLGDTAENAVNLGIAGVGSLTGTTPSLLRNSVGTSEWIRNQLRSTGMAGLSPDNPTPDSKMGTAAFDLAARGGFIPGNAMAAIGSMIAEKIGGPQWAGVGAMAPALVGRGINAAVSSVKPNPEAAALRKEGVELTPGQNIGGTVKRLEDAGTSVPVLGDAIKAAQRRSVETFDAAAINRALAPIGEKLPKGMVGNKAIEYAYGKLGDAYENLLPNLKGDLNYRGPANALPAQAGQAAPASLMDDLNNIKQMGANLPEPQRGQLNRIIEREVVARFTPQGLASGETLKDIESQLGSLSKTFGRSENYDVRTLSGAVKEVQNSLRRMVERVNPSYQGELAKINDGYANFKVTQNAASSVGAAEGVFSPAQLHRAVKAKDISKDKARFAEGNARMQDLSTAGKAVLPSTVPDSGTPLRSALMYALAHPLKATALAGPIGLATLPYTPLGQSALQGILSSQPKPMNPIPPLIMQGILSNRGE